MRGSFSSFFYLNSNGKLADYQEDSMEEVLRISAEMQRVGLSTEQEQARLAQLRLFTTLLGNKAQTFTHK